MRRMMGGLVVWRSGFCLLLSVGSKELDSVWIWRSGKGFVSKNKMEVIGTEVPWGEAIYDQGISSGK